MRFIISLSWRTLKTGYEEQIRYSPWIKEHVDKAEEQWRMFLLNESPDTGASEHYMFFLDYLSNGPDLPSRFQWYTLRGTDSTLVINKSDIVYAYTHIPWVFFVSTIFPVQLSGWQAVRIDKQGKTAVAFKLGDGEFGRFLIDRSQIGLSAEQKNAKVDEKIVKSITKHPERFLTSESFKLMIEESKRKRSHKLKDLPKAVVGLIDVIDRSLDNPTLDSLQQKVVAYAHNLIANDLANLTSDKATEIDSSISRILAIASVTHLDFHCRFETDRINAAFLVCLPETKEEQIRLASEILNEIKNKRMSNDKRFMLCFLLIRMTQYCPARHYTTSMRADLPINNNHFINW